MKKQSYFQHMTRRVNFLQDAFLTMSLALSSWPKMLIEVFIRKNFGESYFNLTSAITALVVFAIMPIYFHAGVMIFSPYRQYMDFQWGIFLLHNLTWYLFLGAFLYMSIIRWKEIRRNPSTFDMAKYSRSTGDIDQRFYDVRIKGKRPDVRTIETLIEPAPFFIAGLVLVFMAQSLGFLLIISSLLYALSYRALYYIGDQFMLDKIDEMIVNQEMERAFVDDLESSQTCGFRFVGRRPESMEVRRMLLGSLLSEGEAKVQFVR